MVHLSALSTLVGKFAITGCGPPEKTVIGERFRMVLQGTGVPSAELRSVKGRVGRT